MSNRLEDDWKNSENGGRTSQKKRPIENGDSDQTTSDQSNITLTITLKGDSTAFAPSMTKNNITGDVNMNLHVETRERKADSASSPQAKEPQADSSEDQRDEDMEVSN